MPVAAPVTVVLGPAGVPKVPVPLHAYVIGKLPVTVEPRFSVALLQMGLSLVMSVMAGLVQVLLQPEMERSSMRQFAVFTEGVPTPE